MHDTAQAKIFLASARGATETDWFRSYNSFCFGHYRDPDKTAFGPLYVLNDDTLAGGRRFALEVEEDTDFLLLPVVGAVGCRVNDEETLTQAGQITMLSLSKGVAIELFNPYEDELVNFLQLWIRRPSEATAGMTTDFSLDEHRNRLLEIASRTRVYRMLIAKVGGRDELVHTPDPGSGLFVFVIEGAFEVQNRLLEARDGLSLLQVETLEAEALSNDAILLLIELADFSNG